MRYGSVCSGIEAASVAWHPLGWQAAWLAEIEPFPSAVLAHHYPQTPNLGDMTKIAPRVLAGEVEAPDVLVGGTPCQAFSVAGMREGLNDPRGELTIKYVGLANAVDDVRARAGKPAAIVVWENVPGVLSDKGNAFGCFLGALAGEDCALEPAGGKWTDAGCVYGPQRAIAWRILDAQYFGLAQRRRRVFLVASARADFDPCAVLFERDSVRRDTAPSREAGQDTAGTLASRTTGGGFPGTDEACSGYLQPVPQLAQCLTTGTGQRYDPETETILPVLSVHGTQDPDTLRDMAHTLGRNQGQENAVFAVRTAQQSSNGWGIQPGGPAYTLDTHAANGQAVCVTGEITHTLRAEGAEGADASEDGTGRGTPIVFDPNQITSPDNRSNPQPGAACHTLPAKTEPPMLAYSVALRGREGGATAELGDDVAGCLRASSGCGDKPHALLANQVRRLTPVECERLQGFPDGYTAIPWRTYQEAARKGLSYESLLTQRGMTLRGLIIEDCPDGPRYKALGNSKAVPVVRWIGRRIEQALQAC